MFLIQKIVELEIGLLKRECIELAALSSSDIRRVFYPFLKLFAFQEKGSSNDTTTERAQGTPS